MAFKTPESWQRTIGVKPRYDDVHFERRPSSGKKGTILGVGGRLFDAALEQACQLPDAYTEGAFGSETGLLFVFRCYDRITGNVAQPKTIIYGVLREGESIRILKDWQVLQMLNELASNLKPPADSDPATSVSPRGNTETLIRAEDLLREAFSTLDLPFRQPELELLGIVAGKHVIR
jgi:hypothetical protein